MKKMHIAGSAILAGAIIAGCGEDAANGQSDTLANGRDPNEVVVEVSGQKLTEGMLCEDVEKILAVQGDSLPADQAEYMRQMIRNQLAQSFAVEQALLAKAKEEGYVVTDDDRTRKTEELLAAAASRPNAPKTLDELLGKFPLGLDRAKKEFENGLVIDKMLKAECAKLADSDYAAEAQKIIDRIVAKNSAQAGTEAEALAKITSLKSELSAPGTDVMAKFAELAKENSDCPSSAKGGDLGEFTHGQMVAEFDKAAFELPIGVVSDPVKTQFGYHLILVTKKTPAVEATDATPAAPEKVQASHILVKAGDVTPVPTLEEVVKYLENQGTRTKVQKIIETIMRASDIKVSDEFKSILPSVETPAEK